MQFVILEKLLKITKAKDSKSDDMVTLPLSTFNSILRAAAAASPVFDEAFYLSARPDVALALKRGDIKSARAHYGRTGYFEGLLPSRIAIDEGYYLSSNPDIAAAFKKGQIKNPQVHFEAMGYKEGRLPKMDFSVWEQL